MQYEAININDNFWAIQPSNKRFYITCLQYSYSISLHFLYNIIYLPDGCQANAIPFVLPSNNKINIEPTLEAPENKLGFNKSYSKINNFCLMQSPNISSLTDENIANKIPEMKHMSVFSMNKTLT